MFHLYVWFCFILFYFSLIFRARWSFYPFIKCLLWLFVVTGNDIKNIFLKLPKYKNWAELKCKCMVGVWLKAACPSSYLWLAKTLSAIGLLKCLYLSRCLVSVDLNCCLSQLDKLHKQPEAIFLWLCWPFHICMHFKFWREICSWL